jgi:two-component system response regulator NreC
LRILLVDEQAILRAGLRCVLQQHGFQVVGEAMSVGEAARLPVQADVVLADLVLPDGRGVDVIRALRSAQPTAAVLVFTTMGGPDDVVDALQAGANGYLLKDAGPVEVVDAVRRVAAGEVYLQPSLGAALLRAQAQRRAGRDVAATIDLTPREKDVLRHVALGHTNVEMSAMLCMSVRTVEAHRSRLVRKLGLQTRAQLVRYAAKVGLLHFDRL